MSNRFENKVAIVTGAAGEIGQALITIMTDEGAKIVAVDHDGAGLAALEKSYAESGQPILAIQADVSKADAVEKLVKQATNTFGGIDIMINNAGIEGVVLPAEDYPEDVFDQVMAVNVRGVFLGTKYVIPALRERGGGSIVNLASVAGMTGSAGTIAYNASKHAVVGMTRSAAVGLGPENIRVNAVCPSPVTGRMMESLEAGVSPEDPLAARDMMSQRIPMQRYAEPVEVANLICFLCSADAAFLNGGLYTVDGGVTASL